MASKNIKGITIQLDGDTKNLSSALKDVNKDLKKTQSDLKLVNSALKLDPSSVELLADKQSLLSDAVQETEQKLQTLKDAYDSNLSNPDVGADEMRDLKLEIDRCAASLTDYRSQLDSVSMDIDSKGMEDMADATDDASASAESLAENLDDVESAADNAGRTASDTMEEFGKKVSSVGDTLTKSITAPLTALAGISYKSWTDITDGMDAVVTRTGATGEALESMRDLVKEIPTEINTSFKNAGDAVGEINTKFGVTDDELKSLSKRFLQFTDLNGTDIVSSVDGIQASMAAWRLSTEETYGVLDILNKVGQDTGANVLELANELQQNAVVMQELGFDYAESAQFLGDLSKSGLDASSVLNGLSKAFSSGVKDGKSVNQVLADLQKTLTSSETTTDAYAAALDVFGRRTFAQLSQAMQDGTLSFDIFIDRTEDAADSVEKTFADTVHPIDEMAMSMNELKLEAQELFNVLGPILVQVMHTAIPIIKEFADMWSSLSPDTQELIVKMGMLAAAAGPVLSVGGRLISSFSGVAGAVGGLLGKLGGGAGGVGGALLEAGEDAAEAGGGLASAAGGMKSLSDSALGFISAGAGLALAAAGMWVLADAAIKMSQEGQGAYIAVAELAVAIGALAGVFALLGDKLTAGAAGIGVFGASVLGIGVGIGVATAGIGYLLQQLPELEGMGAEVAVPILAVGEAIALIAVESLAAGAGILAFAGAFVGFDVAILATDAALVTFDASMVLAAGSVALLDAALIAMRASFDAITDDATTTAEAIAYIDDSIDIIKTGVDGLKDAVSNGLEGIVDFFKSQSTKPVEAWTDAFTDLYDATVTQMNNVITIVSNGIDELVEKFSGTVFKFGGVELPHFSMKGNFDAQKGTVPTVDVDWYARGGIFNSPQVIGVGDSKSAEAVVPIDRLQQMVDFNNTQSNGQVVQLLSQMIGLMSQYMPNLGNNQIVMDTGVLVGQITPAMDRSLGQRADRRARQ